MKNFNINFKEKIYNIPFDERKKLLKAINHNFSFSIKNGKRTIDYETKYLDMFMDLVNYIRSNTNRKEMRTITLIAEGTYHNNTMIGENKNDVDKKTQQDFYPDWDSFCLFNKVDNKLDIKTIIKLVILESLMLTIGCN